MKLCYDLLPSSVAFKFNLRRYTKVAAGFVLHGGAGGAVTGVIKVGRCRLTLSNPR